MKYSKFSGNYSIELNNKLLTKNNVLYNSEINYSFKVKELEFNIYKKGDGYELTIEGTIFKNFYENKKRRTVFIKIDGKNY